jgi:hypothetical protein
MLESLVKMEPVSSHETEPEQSLFVSGAGPNQSASSASETREVPARWAPTSICAWQHCSHVDLLQQVEIKEQAVKEGMKFLRKLEDTLHGYATSIKSSAKWIDRIRKSNIHALFALMH